MNPESAEIAEDLRYRYTVLVEGLEAGYKTLPETVPDLIRLIERTSKAEAEVRRLREEMEAR